MWLLFAHGEYPAMKRFRFGVVAELLQNTGMLTQGDDELTRFSFFSSFAQIEQASH